MPAAELENYQFIDDRTANQLRIYDSGNGQDKLVVDDGGAVRIPNGDLSLDSNDVRGLSLIGLADEGFGNNLIQNFNGGRDLRLDGNQDVRIYTGGSEILSARNGGPVEVLGSSLEIPEGEFIRDGGGTRRYGFNSSDTTIFDQTGTERIFIDDSIDLRLFAQSNSPVTIQDSEGGFTAVQYDTDPTAGVLRAGNAGLFVQGAGKPASGEGISIRQTPGDPTIESENYDTTTYVGMTIRAQGLNLDARGGLVDLSNGGGSDLRLATGQAIEDGAGTLRVGINSGNTSIYDEVGTERFRAANNFGTIIRSPDEAIQIIDDNGGFTPIKYITSSSSLGVLELTNAVLDARNQIKIDSGGAETDRPQLNLGDRGAAAGDPPSGEAVAWAQSGELQAKDDAGNQTTLT